MGKGAMANKPCPCGSGKKYKKCCMNKPDDSEFSDPRNFKKTFKSVKNVSRIKQCLYPNHNECSEQIIGAHSFQNNGILRSIAENGILIMPYAKADNPFAPMTHWGRKEASVFTGFCKYHDNVVFSPIENHDFIGSEEQVFLFVYRCFAREYHTKQEMVKFGQEMHRRKPSAAMMPKEEDIAYSMGLGVRDLNRDKAVFDQALCNHKYDCLTYMIWEFDIDVKFVASGLEAPSYDLQFNKIQNLENEACIACYMYYCVFPQKGKTYCIIAWVKHNDRLFAGYKNQLELLNEVQRRNYINTTLPITSENIMINPSAWDHMPQCEKDEFGMLYMGLNVMCEMDGHPLDRTEPNSFDLFTI